MPAAQSHLLDLARRAIRTLLRDGWTVAEIHRLDLGYSQATIHRLRREYQQELRGRDDGADEIRQKSQGVRLALESQRA